MFPTLSSSPEELLNLTSELFKRWLDVGCSPLIETCILPTLPPPVERKDYGPSRARLLTTRAISEKEGQPDKLMDSTQPSSNSGPPSFSYYSPVWSPLLFRLYWWLLPQLLKKRIFSMMHTKCKTFPGTECLFSYICVCACVCFNAVSFC